MYTPKIISSPIVSNPYQKIADVEPTVRARQAKDVPSIKNAILSKDGLAAAVQILCLAIGLICIWWSKAALWLGQINQLVVIGFVLSLAALASEGVVLRTALVSAGARSSIRLEDLDSILRKDILTAKSNPVYRLLLLLLIACPMGLSVAYKRFIGGHTVTSLNARIDGQFGLAAVPGRQRIGDGLSLLVDAYVPFWIDPGVNRTYGFNLFIVDNTTAAVLDTPRPEYLSLLQSSLGPEQSLSLTAKVNATISRTVGPSDEQRNSQEYWNEVATMLDSDYPLNGGNVYGSLNTLWTNDHNGSVVFASIWNTTQGQTMMSEAVRAEQMRGLAEGTWLITPNNVTLQFASLDIHNSVGLDQTLIWDNLLSIQVMFAAFVGEYDWHNRAGAFDYPYQTLNNSADTRWYQPVNTVPALIASMYWARIASLDTIDRPQGVQRADLRNMTAYSVAAEDIAITKSIPALKQSYLLVLVLLVNPFLCLACVFVQSILSRYSVIDADFNTISLAEAMKEGTPLVNMRRAGT